MKLRLLLFILASAAVLSGCVGYGGYGGGYYGSSSVGHRYSRSYPSGYYGDEYVYRYDRYGRPYVSYGYGYPYGSGYGYGASYGSYGYGYPYGYYGGGNYYHPPQYNPGTGAGIHNPPPVMPPRTDQSLRRHPGVSASPQVSPSPDQTLRDFTRQRRVQQAMPSPGYERAQRSQQQEQRIQPEQRMRDSEPDSSRESIRAMPDVSSDEPPDEVRMRKGGSRR